MYRNSLFFLRIKTLFLFVTLATTNEYFWRYCSVKKKIKKSFQRKVTEQCFIIRSYRDSNSIQHRRPLGANLQSITKRGNNSPTQQCYGKFVAVSESADLPEIIRGREIWMTCKQWVVGGGGGCNQYRTIAADMFCEVEYVLDVLFCRIALV